MLHLTVFALFFTALTTSVEIDPNLHHNQLRFPWGVNFKCHGQLHHNLARMWVVTKFNIPPLNKFHFPSVKVAPDCDFNISKQAYERGGSHLRKVASQFGKVPVLLRSICEQSLPMFSLLEKREEFNRKKLLKLVEEDLYGILKSYQFPTRSKRFAGLVISAVMGLITLAVEGISGYLQSKRNKAMANTMDALHEAQIDMFDKLQRYKQDLLLYGTYSLKSTNAVLDTLQGMHANQASLSDSITNLNDFEWPLFYQSFFGPATYAFHLNSHATTVAHRVDFLYKLLIEKVQKLVKGIATLSKGYLPPKLSPPPSFLREISECMALELHKDHHSYKLAFPHESTYYDMKLATFSLDRYFNLIVTFPIFIVPYNHQPLSLYEIETVPVPIEDQDQEASSFSELMVQKPYFAASDSS